MIRSLFLFFIVLNSFCVSAQTLILQQFKGTVQYSSNGKTNWKNCQLNQDVSGFIRLAEGASCILGKDGKSIFWKKKGDYAISELNRELLGYNSDAAAVLWELVTHHESQKKNAIGGVYRGIGGKFDFMPDSACVPMSQNISFHFDNPNELIFQFELKNNENSDTIISSKKEHVDFTFKSIGQYQWKLYPVSKLAESKSKTLFVISEEEYQGKLNRYMMFRSALSDIEVELKEELLELYLETNKLGYFP
jgi:hypothetical protein